MKYPAQGNYEEYSFHEMLVYLVQEKFKGSLEIVSEDAKRIFHFSGGSLCAASSDLNTEQLDRIIESEVAPSLDDEKKAMVNDRVEEGQKYGKALVEAGVLNAADLLDFSKKQAKIILENTLKDSIEAYVLSERADSSHRPLPFNIIEVIHKSLLNDADENTIKRLLDDEASKYMSSSSAPPIIGDLKDDEEISSILKHLDGKRSLKDIANKIGLNPDRTSRILAFLQLVKWIEPSTGDAFITDEPEDDFFKDEEEEAIPGAAEKYQNDSPMDEESADILKLIDDEKDSVDDFATEHAVAAKELGEEIEDEVSLGNPVSDVEMPDEESSTFADYIDDSGKKGSASGGGLVPVLLKFVLPAVVVVALVITFLFIFLPSQDKTKPEETPNDISFYSEKIQTEQLPIDKDFANSKENPAPTLKVDLEDPVESSTATADDSAKETADSTPDQVAESKPITALPVDQLKDQRSIEITQQETPTSNQEDKKDTAEESRNTSIQTAQQTKPDTEESAPVKKNTVSNEIKPWGEIQPSALDLAVRNRWLDAINIWDRQITSLDPNGYSIHVTSTSHTQFISAVFERFANSSRLREVFYVVRPKSGRFNICWGFFPDRQEARDALASLPASVKKYAPKVVTLAETKR